MTSTVDQCGAGDSPMTTLTVKETVYYSAQLQLPTSMSKCEKIERADMVIKEMGSQNSMNTRVGGWSKRDISGGQRRRVSICIEILTRPPLLFLDEPTSGLDTTASYHVMSRIIKLAEKDKRTVIASIHQPSSEVFELFHNLCLLSYGRLVYFGPTSSANKEGPILKKGNQSSSLTQCILLTKRSFVNMYRAVARAAILSYVASLLTLTAIGSFPSFVEDLKIFHREKLNGHYGIGAYVIGNTLSSIPFLIINSLIPGAIAYYLVGLQNKFTHFFYFALLLFVAVMLVESLMMVVASIVPDFLMGIITGAGVQGVMMLTGGFHRLPDDLPKPFCQYPMYYISFHKYKNQGLYKNELIGLVFPPFITGDWLLRNTWQMEMGYSKVD
ncbi:hypothetical protein Droror1_Dr00021873 [Drosera rotundifolia]